MYKNRFGKHQELADIRFNPCFNGSMYKNDNCVKNPTDNAMVSILVLMDLCIKTLEM